MLLSWNLPSNRHIGDKKMLMALVFLGMATATEEGDPTSRHAADVNVFNDMLQHQQGSWLVPSSLFADDGHDEYLVDDGHENTQNNRKLNVKIETCTDTSSWFPTRASDGVNLFDTFFDCDCSGDLGSYYTYHCRLNDYCFIDLIDNTTEHCINWNVTYDFSVDETTGIINTVERGDFCVDYLQAGPRGRICHVDNNVCGLKMRNDHSYSTESATEICRNTTLCPDLLVNDLGYTEERMLELCPSITMDGTECADFGTEECQDTESDDPKFYRTTRDCSNVEACAKATCQEFLKVYPGPERIIHVYPECNYAPSSAPTSSPPSDTATDAPSSADDSMDDDEMLEEEAESGDSSASTYYQNSILRGQSLLVVVAMLTGIQVRSWMA